MEAKLVIHLPYKRVMTISLAKDLGAILMILFNIEYVATGCDSILTLNAQQLVFSVNFY